jgi:hypothetical protein
VVCLTVSVVSVGGAGCNDVRRLENGGCQCAGGSSNLNIRIPDNCIGFFSLTLILSGGFLVDIDTSKQIRVLCVDSSFFYRVIYW